VTREEVEKIVEEADKDGTGLLSEKEFVNSSAGEGVSVVSF
jgi:Ca2+-binding EF-hand superfamily protein